MSWHLFSLLDWKASWELGTDTISKTFPFLQQWEVKGDEWLFWNHKFCWNAKISRPGVNSDNITSVRWCLFHMNGSQSFNVIKAERWYPSLELLFKLSHDFLCILCVEVSLQENSQLSVKLIWIFNIPNCGFLFNRQMEFTSINYPVITQTRCICQSIFSHIIKYIRPWLSGSKCD